MNRRFQKLFREEFKNLLSTKTGWGKNEVLSAFDRASANAALQMLDEQSDNSK